MKHMLQVYNAFDTSVFLRSVHVLACIDCQVYKAIRCMRRKEEINAVGEDSINNSESVEEEEKGNENNDGDWGEADDWGDDGDDWGDDDDDNDDDNGDDGEGKEKEQSKPTTDDIQEKINKAMEKMKLVATANVPATVKEGYEIEGIVDKRLQYFSPKKIHFYEEPETADEEGDSRAQQLLEKYIQNGGVIGQVSSKEVGATEVAEEEYEDEVVHGDAVFDLYLKRISRWPQQIIRYNEGGAVPLQQTSNHRIPKKASNCPHCGETRLYELQLLPTIVDELDTLGKDGDSGDVRGKMLFGAVTVYTCIGDCVGNKLPEGGWTEEIVDVSPAVE
eukprot:m.128539 g.128539  ORF g.128539 m.128539 type:complete len:333 (+) comp9452_c4_seq5:5170-6168(+)